MMIWLPALLACSKTPAPPEAAASSGPSVPTRVHMDDHLYRATAIRDAVVMGRFEDARADFQWVAEHAPDPALPDEVAGWLAAMRGSAAAGAAAQTVQAQAAALGSMAAACGGCHAALGTGPQLEEPLVPVRGDSLRAHMTQHSWAHGRMWAALVEPSTEAWERALLVLRDEAVPAADIADWGLQEGSREQDQTVHQLAHDALSADSTDTLADAYGQIAAACATCHRAARGEPHL